MKQRILVTYESVTGFTKQYAEWIAEALGCTAVAHKQVSAKELPDYDVVIYGGRCHAGMVSGLKKAKEKVGTSKLVVFAVGAMPNTETATIAEMWKNNFTETELEAVPHFYMQGGLCYEKMPLGDRLMMKVFASMMKKKQDKSEAEQAMAKAIAGSFDISSKEYIEPLVEILKQRNI